jgi:hypothetical protein
MRAVDVSISSRLSFQATLFIVWRKEGQSRLAELKLRRLSIHCIGAK